MPLEPYHKRVDDPYWRHHEWRPALNADGSLKTPEPLAESAGE